MSGGVPPSPDPSSEHSSLPGRRAAMVVAAVAVALSAVGLGIAAAGDRPSISPVEAPPAGRVPRTGIEPVGPTADTAPVVEVPAAPGGEDDEAGRPSRRSRGSSTPALRSRSIGEPFAGRTEGDVPLRPEGATFFSWDPIQRRQPNRLDRRFGTDLLVLYLERVLAGYKADHPDAPRVGIGDLSRPGGGPFGSDLGGLGHASHQNGRDVDLYYPRLDRREQPPDSPDQIDRRLSQDLVDRFVESGAQFVFVGYRTGLRGPRGRVQNLPLHDDHMHVRIGPVVPTR